MVPPMLAWHRGAGRIRWTPPPESRSVGRTGVWPCGPDVGARVGAGHVVVDVVDHRRRRHRGRGGGVRVRAGPPSGGWRHLLPGPHRWRAVVSLLVRSTELVKLPVVTLGGEDVARVRGRGARPGSAPARCRCRLPAVRAGVGSDVASTRRGSPSPPTVASPVPWPSGTTSPLDVVALHLLATHAITPLLAMCCRVRRPAGHPEAGEPPGRRRWRRRSGRTVRPADRRRL